MPARTDVSYASFLSCSFSLISSKQLQASPRSCDIGRCPPLSGALACSTATVTNIPLFLLCSVRLGTVQAKLYASKSAEKDAGLRRRQAAQEEMRQLRLEEARQRAEYVALHAQQASPWSTLCRCIATLLKPLPPTKQPSTMKCRAARAARAAMRSKLSHATPQISMIMPLSL